VEIECLWIFGLVLQEYLHDFVLFLQVVRVTLGNLYLLLLETLHLVCFLL
jgi:hypothetical protein